MYTTAEQLRGRELCGMLNEALRDDRVGHAVTLSRALNLFCVTGRAPGSAPVRLPGVEPQDAPGGRTWRGGALPRHHRHFYVAGKRYRVPMFLSTSSSKDKAVEFMRDRGGPDMVLWEFRFHSSGQCRHVNFINRHDGSLGSNPNLAAEDEFLFSPYSAFTVVSVVWTDAPSVASPNRVVLQPEIDNKDAPDDLPLAAWC